MIILLPFKKYETIWAMLMNIIRNLIVIFCFYPSIITKSIWIHSFRTLFSRSLIKLSWIQLCRNFWTIIWLSIVLLYLRNIESHLSLRCCLLLKISLYICSTIVICIIRILNMLGLLFIVIFLNWKRILSLIFIILDSTIFKFINLSTSA